MNSESNTTIQGTQSGKSISYKRAHRASLKPVLVTDQVEEATAQTINEAPLQETPDAIEEQPTSDERATRRRGPKFFASVDRAEKTQDEPKADPVAARLARALRGRGASTKETPAAEQKTVASPAKAGAKPAPRSSFKTRYIWGMVGYLLVADVAGGYIRNFMVANKIDAQVFQFGPIIGYRSTLIFLLLLVVILVLFARFDLIPRSLGGLVGGGKTTTPTKGTTRPKDAKPTFETKATPVAIKQGVKGEHDDLYKEYRETQRYYQRRDRKR